MSEKNCNISIVSHLLSKALSGFYEKKPISYPTLHAGRIKNNNKPGKKKLNNVSLKKNFNEVCLKNDLLPKFTNFS